MTDARPATSSDERVEFPLPRYDLLGIEVTAATMDTAVGQISAWVESGESQYVCVADANSIVGASGDEQLREVYNRAGMVVPDGVPLVWAGKYAGFRSMSRVCGPDLLPEMLTVAAQRGWSSYFYGGAPGVAEQMVDRFEADIPGLKVAGITVPEFRPLSAEELAQDIARINESGAALVWVGLGAPKQERWMAQCVDMIDSAVLIGVGAAFDMHAGRVRRAPEWMQRHGLEWLFRLRQEPRRLWRRYARAVPALLWGVVRRRPKRLEP